SESEAISASRSSGGRSSNSASKRSIRSLSGVIGRRSPFVCPTVDGDGATIRERPRPEPSQADVPLGVAGECGGLSPGEPSGSGAEDDADAEQARTPQWFALHLRHDAVRGMLNCRL